MPPRAGDERLLARLDRDLARSFAGERRVVVAFSAGLASLVLAALARKHGDLRCIVVGTRRAADLGAALVARDFLDYRLEIVTPSPADALRTATRLRAAAPRLALAEVLDLVPLALVEGRCPDATVVSGFGLTRASPAFRRHLATRPAMSPGVRQEGSGPSRTLVLRLGRELALPDGFIGMGHRRPAEGSGIGPTLRALAHAHHRSVGALVAGRV